MTVAIDYVVNAQIEEFVCGLAFIRKDGTNLSGPNTKLQNYRIPGPPPGTTGTLHYNIERLPLLGAGYRLTASIYDSVLKHAYDHIEDAVTFRVTDDKGRFGMVDLDGKWSDTSIEQPASKAVTA
jgi:hypothetical protein